MQVVIYYCAVCIIKALPPPPFYTDMFPFSLSHLTRLFAVFILHVYLHKYTCIIKGTVQEDFPEYKLGTLHVYRGVKSVLVLTYTY
jgi:hypothetical protein